MGQCEHVNVNPNIHVFHRIVHLEDRYTYDDQVKELITRWVKYAPKQTMSIFMDYLHRKSMKVDDWLCNFNKSNYIMDEMGLYVLSRILHTGIGVVLKNSVWTTKKNNGVDDIDIWFAYLGLGSFFSPNPTRARGGKEAVKNICP